MALSTTRRARYRQIANRVRAIPGEHGLRPHRVYLRTTTRTGTHTGDGTLVETEVELLENGQPPKVRKVSGERVFSDDAPDTDTYMVGPVTPVAGTSWDDLLGADVTVGDTWNLRIESIETGSSVLCRIADVENSRALHVMITAVAVRTD